MKSIWNDSFIDLKAKQPLTENIKTDVLVIGGGMAGILCAYSLTAAGADCLLVEKGIIGGINTKNTTAKITVQHGAIYNKIIKKYGHEAARMYYEVSTEALDKYKEFSKLIDCDLEEKTAYIYSSGNFDLLKEEAASYNKLKIAYTWRDSPPIPVKNTKALGIPGQAQFHPLKLIKGLLGKIRYYENTPVLNIIGNTAYIPGGSVTAKHIVLATHYPIINIPGSYFIKLTQQRSYVTAYTNAPDVDGMYIDVSGTGFSFRNYNKYLLVGGGGHKTGKSGEGWGAAHSLISSEVPGAHEAYHWAAQDCISLDSIPYIGVHSNKKTNIYVAAGFNKWGMTGAMSASAVLTDLILTGSSRYEALFDPGRSMLSVNLFKNLGSAAAGLIRPGKRCPHMGCGLKYNKKEKSWDCPCHGSRFDSKGNIIDSPAKRRLKIEK